MKLNLFGYTLTVSLAKNDMTADVERLAKTYRSYGASPHHTKITRIKAYRVLTHARLRLQDSKKWVEAHFAE